MPLAFEPVVHPDGTFDVAFDAETVTLLFIDQRNDEAASPNMLWRSRYDVAMEAMSAIYSGTLLDEMLGRWPGRTLEMSVKTSDGTAIAAQQTDETGRFRFTGVPCKVPLQFDPSTRAMVRDYLLFDRDRLFNPGEVREDDTAQGSAANLDRRHAYSRPSRWPRLSKTFAGMSARVGCSPGGPAGR